MEAYFGVDEANMVKGLSEKKIGGGMIKAVGCFCWIVG